MWVYRQSTGQLSKTVPEEGDMLMPVAVGYAGAGVGTNNPELQDVPNVGPLPRGMYQISKPFTHAHLGPYTMRLIPAPGNEMHGRAGFCIHGDNPFHTASEGCIVLEYAIRHRIAYSGDSVLQVVA